MSLGDSPNALGGLEALMQRATKASTMSRGGYLSRCLGWHFGGCLSGKKNVCWRGCVACFLLPACFSA